MKKTSQAPKPIPSTEPGRVLSEAELDTVAAGHGSKPGGVTDGVAG